MPLYAGSTNVVHYTSRVDGIPTEGDTIALTVYDANADEVTVAADPLWDAAYENEDGLLGSYTLVIESDELPLTLVDTDLEFIWVWTTTIDGIVQTLTDYETVHVVKGLLTGPELTVGTNSYVTMDEAVAYMDTILGTTAWDEASEADRAKALVMATRRIETMAFRGRKVDEDQTLQFPRAYFGKGESLYSEEHERFSSMSTMQGWVWEEEVPQAVKDFQCEEALVILRDAAATTDRITLQSQGVTSVRIGDYSETFSSSSKSMMYGSARATDALSLLKPYLAGSVKVV